MKRRRRDEAVGLSRQQHVTACSAVLGAGQMASLHSQWYSIPSLSRVLLSVTHNTGRGQTERINT